MTAPLPDQYAWPAALFEGMTPEAATEKRDRMNAEHLWMRTHLTQHEIDQVAIGAAESLATRARAAREEQAAA